MNLDEFIKRHVYLCFTSILLCVGILTMVDTYYVFQVSPFIIVLITAIWIVILRCFDVNKKNIIPYLVLGIVLIIAVIVIRQLDITIDEMLNNYSEWWKKTNLEGASKSYGYAIFTLFWLLVVTSIPVYLSQKRFILRLGAAIASIIVMAILSIANQPVSKLGVICLISYVLICLVEIRISCGKKFRKGNVVTMTYLLPVLFIITAAMTVMPFHNEPMEWKTIKKIWNAISSKIETWVEDFNFWLKPGQSEFGLNFMGYSEDGSVGGSISEGNRLALSVASSFNRTSDVYLTGNIKSDFDGVEWKMYEQTEEETDKPEEYKLDAMEFLYAVHREGRDDNYEEIWRMRSFEIEYKDISTKTVFYPLKITRMVDRFGPDYSRKTENYRYEKVQRTGNKYSLMGMDLNYGSTAFDELVTHQENYLYEREIPQADDFLPDLRSDRLGSIYEFNAPKKLNRLLYDRVQNIRNHYLHIYDELPQRVIDLAKDVTKDCKGDYEKCKALESWFKTYTYTTNPKHLPKGADLIDYLLFDSKEGYCTYYATAFAVMARCVGVPTRYVQGFCVPVEDQESVSTYLVYNRYAHAWPEAYIEGIGWIPFEPTPSFDVNRYNPWTITQEGEMQEDISWKKDVPSINYTDIINEKEEMERQMQLKRRKTYQGVVIIAVLIILLMILSIPMYLFIKSKKVKHRYHNYTDNDKIYTDIRRIILIFTYRNRSIEPEETLSMYFDRMAELYHEYQDQLELAKNSYIRLRYNEETLGSKEQFQTAMLYKQLLVSAKVNMNKVAYLKLKYHLLDCTK